MFQYFHDILLKYTPYLEVAIRTEDLPELDYWGRGGGLKPVLHARNSAFITWCSSKQ